MFRIFALCVAIRASVRNQTCFHSVSNCASLSKPVHYYCTIPEMRNTLSYYDQTMSKEFDAFGNTRFRVQPAKAVMPLVGITGNSRVRITYVLPTSRHGLPILKRFSPPKHLVSPRTWRSNMAERLVFIMPIIKPSEIILMSHSRSDFLSCYS